MYSAHHVLYFYRTVLPLSEIRMYFIDNDDLEFSGPWTKHEVDLSTIRQIMHDLR
jgi:hypothetical protein